MPIKELIAVAIKVKDNRKALNDLLGKQSS